ncbi:MAG TPA: hypothetical protein VNO21_05900 [Polyangiaceae bacterium]|nr:hypothetical protein [Polyangiaceae bacterium]
MVKNVVLSSLAVLALFGGTAIAQGHRTTAVRIPASVTANTFDRFKHQSRFAKFNHLSAESKGLIQAGAQESNGRLPSFPTFNDSFNFGGTNFPYTMVGHHPRAGGEVRVDTSFIVLNFLFDEFLDDNGNNLFIDSAPIVNDVIGSPNYVATPYSTGFAQFSDAVQRASFFNVMRSNWHTSIERPRMLKPVTIEVPIGQASVSRAANGKFIAFVNGDFLFSQIRTILQLEDIRTNELPVLLSRNVSADVFLGFHDAFDVQVNNRKGIQTYTYTSWFDPDVIDPIFADATTITHEISEWVADPFVNNIVPNGVIPDSGGACLNFLEVGDPIEFLPNQMAPITVRGKVYHTQVETTVQWFSREVPSSAFAGAYSYPDTTVLTAPSDPCPTP